MERGRREGREIWRDEGRKKHSDGGRDEKKKQKGEEVEVNE